VIGIGLNRQTGRRQGGHRELFPVFVSARRFELRAERTSTSASADSPASEHVTAEIEYKQGLAQRSLGNWKDALQSWEKALARFESNGEFESAGKICAILNSQLSWSGRWADSIKMGARGLALLAERVSPDRCRMLSANGATLSLAGHHDAGIAMIRQAGAMAAELHNARLKGIALYAEMLHHYGYMRPREILEISLNAMEQLSANEDAWLISDVQCFRIGSHLALANFGELARAYAELKPLAVRLGNLVALISANRDQMSQQLIFSGDIPRWPEFMLSDLAECERIHNPALSAGSLSCLGIVEMWCGKWDEAWTYFKEGEAREPAGPIGGNWILVAMVKGLRRRFERGASDDSTPSQ
jgi:tetratricopeptide (TPR) repeat protein